MITQFTGVAAFGEQLTEGVVAEFQLLLLTVARGKSDRELVVGVDVGVVGETIFGVFLGQIAFPVAGLSREGKMSAIKVLSSIPDQYLRATALWGPSGGRG